MENRCSKHSVHATRSLLILEHVQRVVKISISFYFQYDSAAPYVVQFACIHFSPIDLSIAPLSDLRPATRHLQALQVEGRRLSVGWSHLVARTKYPVYIDITLLVNIIDVILDTYMLQKKLLI